MWNDFDTCGMMVILDLRSSSPSTPMLMLSMRMEPPADSMIRNRARVSDDLPAPVRPTIPTCNQQGVHCSIVVGLLTNLCTPRYFNRDVPQDKVQSLSVTSGVLVKLDMTLTWPLRRWLMRLHNGWGLCGGLCILLVSLNSHNMGF